MVDSCHTCTHCGAGHEQFCVQGSALTYNGTEMDRVTHTYGGYSTRVVVDERFVLRVPESLDPAGAAPLLCAGITTYSPLRRFGCGPGTRVGVVGLGGLGHMAVKLARSMGAVVTVLSTSAKKEADARALGATDFLVTTTPDALATRAGTLDLIIDTVSAPHDYNAYLNLLRPHGAMVLVGAPPEPSPLLAFALIMGNRTLAGSVIGGIAETQEMLDRCAAHGIVSDVELIPIQQVNEAYERVLPGTGVHRKPMVTCDEPQPNVTSPAEMFARVIAPEHPSMKSSNCKSSSVSSTSIESMRSATRTSRRTIVSHETSYPSTRFVEPDRPPDEILMMTSGALSAPTSQ
jgi:uncharacterized zinc-type alcohol dehydrogenase-like protein